MSSLAGLTPLFVLWHRNSPSMPICGQSATGRKDRALPTGRRTRQIAAFAVVPAWLSGVITALREAAGESNRPVNTQLYELAGVAKTSGLG